MLIYAKEEAGTLLFAFVHFLAILVTDTIPTFLDSEYTSIVRHYYNIYYLDSFLIVNPKFDISTCRQVNLLPWVITKQQDVILMILVDQLPAYSLAVLELAFNTKHAGQSMLQFFISRESTNVNGPAYSSTFVDLQDLCQAHQKNEQQTKHMLKRLWLQSMHDHRRSQFPSVLSLRSF